MLSITRTHTHITQEHCDGVDGVVDDNVDDDVDDVDDFQAESLACGGWQKPQ